MRMIPLRFQAVCAYCADDIDTRTAGVYSLQSGWMKNRSQGGGNALALRQPIQPLRWACGGCIDKMQHGMSVGQQTLFA